MTLKELRDKLAAKREQLREVFKQVKVEADGRKSYDFAKATADWLGADVLALEGEAKSARIIDLCHERSAELDDLQDEVTKLETIEQAAARLEKSAREPVNRPGHPATSTGDPERRKSIGQRVTEHPTYKLWAKGQKEGRIELDDVGMGEMKALFQTSAGWGPESTRIGVVVPDVTRPLQVTDIVPSGNTGMAAVVYMEETTRTHAAAERAEGAAYAESTFVLTERSVTVRKVTDSVPVTDEQLEDVAMVSSYLDSRLTFGVQQRLDGQIVSGSGTAPNLQGLRTATGINTVAKAATVTAPDILFTMMQTIRTTGRAQPTHVLLHPDDWSPIRTHQNLGRTLHLGQPERSRTGTHLGPADDPERLSPRPYRTHRIVFAALDDGV